MDIQLRQSGFLLRNVNIYGICMLKHLLKKMRRTETKSLTLTVGSTWTEQTVICQDVLPPR